MTNRSDRQRSVNDHIRLTAAARGVDANRLRRSLVFHRALARVAGHGLILKGGFCLEARLPDAARATKDIDLVGSVGSTIDAEELGDWLQSLFEESSINDGFGFRFGRPTRLRSPGAESLAWRVGLTASVGGAEFERVKLDLVGQVREVSGATEQLTVPPPVPIPGIGAVQVEAVDVYQHAAEKYHAYARIYADERPSTRVKDLVDLVLLLEAGLLVDPLRLRERLRVVYSERDNASATPHLPEPPGDWVRPYAAFAAELGLSAAALPAAYRLVADRYATALN